MVRYFLSIFLRLNCGERDFYLLDLMSVVDDLLNCEIPETLLVFCLIISMGRSYVRSLKSLVMRLPHDALFYLAVDLNGKELPVLIKTCLALGVLDLLSMQSFRDILFISNNQ